VGLAWTDSLIWASGHLRRRPGAAGRADARHAESAPERPARWAAAEAGAEVYLRAEALRSQIAIERADALRPWLEQLSREAPFSVRGIARKVLNDRPYEDDPA
jgi:hypothetical protein